MKPGLLVLGAGAATEAVYLSVTLRLPWPRYGGALHSWSELLGSAAGAFWICLAGVLILLPAYLFGWRAVRKLSQRQQGRVIWSFALAFAVTLFWLLPITSDLFNYLGQAHLLTDLGANPLLQPAAEVNEVIRVRDGLTDPLLSTYATAYAATPSIYGPAWALVSAPATLISSDSSFGLFYLKSLVLLAFLASAWLIHQIVGKLRPTSAGEALYLFAWNPLVLLMAVGDGHNDIVMMAAVLLGLWFLLRESWALAFGALALSASIKYLGALFIPLAVLFVWDRTKRGGMCGPWRKLLWSGFAAAAVTGLLYAPLGTVEWGTSTFYRLLRPANWAWSLAPQQGAGSAGSLPLPVPLSPEVLAWLPTLALVIGLVGFAAIYLYLIVRLILRLNREQDSVCPGRKAERGLSVQQRCRAQQLFDAGFVISLLVFVLGAARSQPWHLIWPASLAGLSAKRWAWAPVIALSLVMLLSQIWVEWGTPGLANLLLEATWTRLAACRWLMCG